MRLCVISIDAMVCEDVPLLLSMKNCAELFKHSARVEQLETVYPSLTHPVHAALLTGCRCGKNGVTHNERFDPFHHVPVWYNQLSDIRCDTIFHAARRAGLHSCAARWPMTACGNGIIDYIVPEVLDADLQNGKSMRDVLAAGGSGPILEDIVNPNLCLLDGNRRPGYDAFSVACCVDIVLRKQPDLLFTHWGMLDSARHRGGMFGPHVRKALTYVDEWVGKLAEAHANAGIFDETNFILLSDHGQLEVERKTCLNVLLVQNGLIDIDNDGNVQDWQAYISSAGLSAQVFLKAPANKQLQKRVAQLLDRLCEEGASGFSQWLTAEEARKRYGLYGRFSFVLETDNHTLFGNETTGAVIRERSMEPFVRANHGHMPHKGCQPTLLAVGPAFNPDTKSLMLLLRLLPQ